MTDKFFPYLTNKKNLIFDKARQESNLFLKGVLFQTNFDLPAYSKVQDRTELELDWNRTIFNFCPVPYFLMRYRKILNFFKFIAHYCLFYEKLSLILIPKQNFLSLNFF